MTAPAARPGAAFIADLPARLAATGLVSATTGFDDRPRDFYTSWEDLYGDDELEDLGLRVDAVFGHDLVVPSPGRGVGRRVYGAVIQLADALGVALVINPWAPSEPEEGHLSQEDLEAWYARLGFAWMQDGRHLMIREPAVTSADVPYLVHYATTGQFLGWVRGSTEEVALGRARARHAELSYLDPAGIGSIVLEESQP